MSAFVVNICGQGGRTIIVDPGSFEVNVGEFWSFDYGEGVLGCGEIIEVSEDIPIYNLVDTYESCFDCITGSSTESSFLFTDCSDERRTINISPLEFGFLPNVGDVYRLSFIEEGRGEFTGCFEFTDTDYGTLPNSELLESTFFGTCENCPPRSANTETTVCVICCDCGATGSTTNIVVPLHPVWTDGYGNEVVQMNMITIGGNGLNG
jgi:hypothetical protein